MFWGNKRNCYRQTHIVMDAYKLRDFIVMLEVNTFNYVVLTLPVNS